MAKTKYDTLVLLPTYDERATLESLVDEILAIYPVHICIIDDNSPDGTGELAESLAKANSRIHVIHRERKEGLGRAYIAGFQFALAHGYQRIVQMDADRSHCPKALPHLIHLTSRYDIAVGSRWIPGGEATQWPWPRRVISQLGSAYARALLSMNIQDATSGFKCIRRRVLETLPLETLQSSGYVFQIEVTHRALQAGFSVVETPITFAEREAGESKMSKRILLEAALRVPLLRLEGTAS